MTDTTVDVRPVRFADETAPSDAAPIATTPSGAAPSDAAPIDAAPSDAAPSDAAPSATAPSDAAPSENVFRNPRFANIPGNTAEIEEKAHALLDTIGADSEDAVGLQHLQDLTTSIGLPAARESFEAMLDANRVNPKLRAEALREIKAFSPITEIGCMQVDFFNMITAAPGTAYLVLDKCPANHDLGAELKKLKTIVDADKWVEVIKHLSMMVYLGRSVYSKIAEANRPLLRRIFGRDPQHDCADLMSLGVDSRNTTLFVNPRWPVRVGIFVRFK